MNRHILKTLFLSIPLILWVSNNALAVTFYENNFDTGTMPKSANDPSPGQPLWTLAQSFPDIYGPGNHYNLSNTSSHSGTYSLRFTYEALNGICNTCGSKFYDHKQSGHNGVSYFIADNKENLSTADNIDTDKDDDGPKAHSGAVIYNRDGGYSKWKVTSVTNHNATNDKLNLQLIRKGINGESIINGGDNIAITRECGVDGIVGIKNGKNDINRRSDCNSAIMWFGNIKAQKPGTSIFRRQYLKAEVTSPAVRQKLHYFRPDRGGPFQGEVVLFGHSDFGTLEPQLSGINTYGAKLPIYKGNTSENFTDLEFKRSTWYYIQEQYKAATIKNTNPGTGKVTEYNNDGVYRLWFSESGSEPAQGNPTLELTGLALPPIAGGTGTHISFWGNVQHSTHARGSWYIDDVIISDTFNAPVARNGINKAATVPPITQSENQDPTI